MGNWCYCCEIIKAPSHDDQAVICKMEHLREIALPGMDVCPYWRRLEETPSMTWLGQVDLVLSLRTLFCRLEHSDTSRF